jgi:hypothetical protein
MGKPTGRSGPVQDKKSWGKDGELAINFVYYTMQLNRYFRQEIFINLEAPKKGSQNE